MIKNIKIGNRLFLLLLGSLFVFSSCYKQERFTEENTDVLGYFPVIAEFWIGPDGIVKSGDEITLDLRFWSNDPIKEVVFYPELGGNPLDSIVVPYSEAAYSNTTQTDSLVYKYTAPDVGTDTLDLVVTATVFNENGLSRTTVGGAWYRNTTKPAKMTIYPK